MPNSDSRPIVFSLFVLLGAIGAMTPLAIDMYLPALPTIGKALSASSDQVQLTLACYTAGFAVGQLVFGPCADHFGRRPVLIIGVGLFTLMAFASAMITNIEQLLVIRALQGLAGGCAPVIVQSTIRDRLSRDDFSRAMSFVTLVMTLAPLTAPLIGGYILKLFGWREIFWSLAAYSVVIWIWSLFKFPETLSAKNKQALNFRPILANIGGLLRSKPAMGYMLCGAFSFSGMFAFLTAGSFVYIEVFGMAPHHVGYLFGINVVALMAATSLNARLVKRLSSRMLHLGLAVQSIAGILLFLAIPVDYSQFGTIGVMGIAIPVALYISVISVIGSNTTACLLNQYPHIAGTVSSISGSLRFGLGSLTGALVSFLPSGNTNDMLLVMGACSILSLLCYLKLTHRHTATAAF